MPASPRRPHVLVLNAALGGPAGNTAVALREAARRLRRQARVTELMLPAQAEAALTAPAAGFTSVRSALAAADALLLGTGVHWDSWSSVLQRFLEAATAAEATSLWLGKPAAVVVTEHSVGGKAVLSRLQGVLVTLGCTLPPLSGLVLSRAALLAAQADPTAARDFWGRADLAVVCANLLTAARLARTAPRPRWRAWPVDRRDFAARWLEP